MCIRDRVIIHAAGEQGFVTNALQIWQSIKSETIMQPDNYHDDIDFCNFSKLPGEKF